MNTEDKTDDSIRFAAVSKDIVVVRVRGRGTFQNSASLSILWEEHKKKNKDIRFILDLEECSTMDSTFLGVVAQISLSQRRAGKGSLAVVNPTAQVGKLFDTLGLNYILDLRREPRQSVPPATAFTPAAASPRSKIENTINMLQAHQTLINLDSKNKVRFRSVIENLEKSIEHQKKSDPM